MKILIINSGSSSIKFKIIQMPSEIEIISGIIERIGEESSFMTIENKAKKLNIKNFIKNHSIGIKKIIEILIKEKIINKLDEIQIIGHRIVHGGNHFLRPLIIDSKNIKKIEKNNGLAPLHNPSNIKGIKICQKIFNKSINIACFDTAFHQTIPEYAKTYGLNYEISKKNNIIKYGFHGLSHEFILEEYCKTYQKNTQQTNIISCHLGSGASICVIKNGKSIDTTMGFTPLEGIMMLTRTGDIDPGIIFYMQKNLGLKLEEVEEIINKKSGLLGVSGVCDGDMREILFMAGYKVENFDGSYINKKYGSFKIKKLEKTCKLAIDIFVYKIQKYLYSYIGLLDQIDAIIFTAGIGERSKVIQELIIGNSKLMQNIKILTIPTNEELMIARKCYGLYK